LSTSYSTSRLQIIIPAGSTYAATYSTQVPKANKAARIPTTANFMINLKNKIYLIRVDLILFKMQFLNIKSYLNTKIYYNIHKTFLW
jgi:hypothetical protein